MPLGSFVLFPPTDKSQRERHGHQADPQKIENERDTPQRGVTLAAFGVAHDFQHSYLH